MRTVLITGCDRGLGLEFARQYAADEWRVIATCLNPDEAEAMRAIPGNVTLCELDVRRGDHMRTMSERLAGEDVDILLSNAGVGWRFPPFGETDYDHWREMLETNTLGPMRLAETFVEHVARSSLKTMAFVSSRMGSISLNLTGGGYGYRSSKAALNAVVRSLALDLRQRDILVLALHPGAARTFGDVGTVDPAESVAGMRAVLSRCGIHETGSFYTFKDTSLPW